MKPIVLFFQSTVSKSWKDKLTGVYAYADKVGWQVQVVEAGSDVALVREMLAKWNPIGCLVDRGLQTGKPPLRLFDGTPVVFLDQNPQTAGHCTCLVHDSSASAALATEELVRLRLPHLAYVSAAKRIFWDHERRTAFAAVAARHRIASSSFSVSDGLDRRLKALPKPCGIVCVNDQAAQKVMAEAMRLGLGVPDELAVIGIDNDEFICEHTAPTLTSVDPGFVEAGYRLAELLDRRIKDPSAREIRETYGPKALVRRESSRWLPNVDGRTRRALDFIRRNFADPDLTVGRVVEAMGCSRALADLLFRKSTGGSIQAEILAVRLAHACALLKTPRQTIGAVPALCGYRSEPFFKRFFKRQTGLTMRQWRKQNALAEPAT